MTAELLPLQQMRDLRPSGQQLVHVGVKRFTEVVMWEHGPFRKCPMCAQHAFGVLGSNCNLITMRCKECGYSEPERLPELDKRVIYLDQFAFSELFKLKGPGRREDKHTEFWVEAERLISRVVLLQQCIFPYSDIHHSETLVSRWPLELRQAYEAIGGDAALEHSQTIQINQVLAFAYAFIQGGEPSIDYDIDRVLRGRRNEWLPAMRVTMNTDYTQFAEAIRAGVAQTGNDIAGLMDSWRSRRLGFEEVLEIELGSFRSIRVTSLMRSAMTYAKLQMLAITLAN